MFSCGTVKILTRTRHLLGANQALDQMSYRLLEAGRARTVSSRLRRECPISRAALALRRATQLDGEQPLIYTIAGDINRITVALQIE